MAFMHILPWNFCPIMGCNFVFFFFWTRENFMNYHDFQSFTVF